MKKLIDKRPYERPRMTAFSLRTGKICASDGNDDSDDYNGNDIFNDDNTEDLNWTPFIVGSQQ